MSGNKRGSKWSRLSTISVDTRRSRKDIFQLKFGYVALEPRYTLPSSRLTLDTARPNPTRELVWSRLESRSAHDTSSESERKKFVVSRCHRPLDSLSSSSSTGMHSFRSDSTFLTAEDKRCCSWSPTKDRGPGSWSVP